MSTTPVVPQAVADPYPGPRPFSPGESAIFQGREKETRDVFDLLLSYQCVVLYSKSGAGKSSLVNAGLLPLLREEEFDVLPVTRVGGSVPPSVDQTQVENIFIFNLNSTCTSPKADSPVHLTADASGCLKGRSEKPSILIVDQFEELFTTHTDRWRDRKPFFMQIQKMCEQNRDLRVLLVIREDHVAELDPYSEMLPNNLRIRYRLERLREEQAIPAIAVPMHLAGFSFDDGVPESLASNLRRIQVQTGGGVKEVEGEFIEPMHLQVVCRNLWQNLPKDRGRVTAGDVQKFANVSGVLSDFYENAVVLAARTAHVRERRIREFVEKRLITPDGTRSAAYKGKVLTGGVPNEAVRVLEEEHIVLAESRSGALWYELTHDRLIGPAKASNRAWFAKRRVRKYAVIALVFVPALVLTAIGLVSFTRKRADAVRLSQERSATDQFSLLTSAPSAAAAHENWDEALKGYFSALPFYERQGDHGRQAEIQTRIGNIYDHEYMYPEALTAYRKALALHQALKDQQAIADDEMLIGQDLGAVYDNKQASEAYAKASDIYKQIGIPLKQANALEDLGIAFRWLARYDDAEKYLRQSLDLYGRLETPTPGQEAEVNFSLASLFADKGEYGEAEIMTRKAQVALKENAHYQDAAMATLNLGSILFYTGRYEEANQEFRQGLAESIRRSYKYGEGAAYAKLSQWYSKKNLCEDSLQYASRSLSISQSISDVNLATLAKEIRGRAFLCAGQLESAKADAREALAASIQARDEFSQAISLDILALIAEKSGDLKSAIQNGQDAVNLFDSIDTQSVYAIEARSNLRRLRSEGSSPSNSRK